MAFDPKIPHQLTFLPPKSDLKSQKFSEALIKARAALAELKGYSFAMPNPLLLLSPAILRESLASSEVENIYTTIIDVLKNQLFPESERNENDKEVLRYREAILWGFEKLPELGMSNRLILGVKNRLVPTGPEVYRRQQNAIANQATGEILYTPPQITQIPQLMSNWEKFVNNKDDDIDPLVKAAVAHYQFEAIHPFEDGNGRAGRILMVLQLVDAGILKWPILFISGYIKNNQGKYYKNLLDISKRGNWDTFILFMLEGFYSQAVETNRTLFDIMDLFEEIKKRLKENHRKIYSADLVESLFAYPVITPVKLGKEMGVHYTTATRHLNELLKGGVLSDQKYGKYHLYINKQLLNVVNRKSEKS